MLIILFKNSLSSCSLANVLFPKCSHFLAYLVLLELNPNRYTTRVPSGVLTGPAPVGIGSPLVPCVVTYLVLSFKAILGIPFACHVTPVSWINIPFSFLDLSPLVLLDNIL